VVTLARLALLIGLTRFVEMMVFIRRKWLGLEAVSFVSLEVVVALPLLIVKSSSSSLTN